MGSAYLIEESEAMMSDQEGADQDRRRRSHPANPGDNGSSDAFGSTDAVAKAC
jgi:hypothetical protein